MTQRHNHYEAAFEALLQTSRVPYVAVDEARRSQMGGGATGVGATGGTLKSLDFIVSPVSAPQRLLVDVKGRRFAGQGLGRGSGQRWKNWSTVDDVESLARWQSLFGTGFVPLLVFAYHVAGPLA
ncbi:MAG: HYExAFE family protein, partial [Planctomycetales bacterium]|nr:HYExAFE family protein [Planctomycetales bacterium]